MNQQIVDDILEWGRSRGILSNSTPEAQFTKTLEEVAELCTALHKNDHTEIKDAIGDVVVTLVLLSELCELNLEDCTTHAYNQIINRTGKLVNGVYVKD